MSGHTEILAALKSRLMAAAPGAAVASTSIAWENKAFKPVAGTRYYRATFLPGEPRAAAVGESAANRCVGIFQIDVFDPPNKLDVATRTEAERIAACFKRGTALVYNGVNVRIEKAYTTKGDSSDPAWFMVSVVVRWRADIAN